MKEQRAQHWTTTVDKFTSAILMDFMCSFENIIESKHLNLERVAERMNQIKDEEDSVEYTPELIQTVIDTAAEHEVNVSTLVLFARALGMKVSLVLYYDDDPDNLQGPVLGETIMQCWADAGYPRDIDLEEPPEEDSPHFISDDEGFDDENDEEEE